MSRSTTPLTLSLWCALALAAAAATSGAPPALSARLQDLHGRTDSLASHRGEPQVVFVISAARLRRLKEWEVKLDERLEGVRYLRVADVAPERGEPRPSHEDVASVLRKRVPQGVAVLVDLERRFARDFELDTQEVNVLLFDAELRWVGYVRGRPSPENLGRVRSRLLELPGVRSRSAAASP